jgi:hypothetical protein
MNSLKHFIMFQRTGGHCTTWLVRAPTLRDAMQQYVLAQGAQAELLKDGSLSVDDGYGGKIVYAHPLACIEAEEKTWAGWEVRELQEEHWQAGFAEVFCSENPHDLKEHIQHCLPLLRQRYPRSRARAFVWYLRDGPLVTFYRRAYQRRRRRIEILVRYHIPWTEWPRAYEWEGTHDTILEQMVTNSLLP